MNYLAEGIRTKPGGTDVLHEMTLGVRSSETRIKDILGEVEGNKIINGLYGEINLQREDHLVPFAWNLDMYRNPPVNWDPTVPFVSTSNDDMDYVRQEAEAIVRLEDAGGVINKDMTHCIIGDYVICVPNPADPLKRPFWVGQVTKNSPAKKELRVHWLLPPSRHPGSVGKKAKGKERKSEDMEVESTVRAPVQSEPSYLSPAAPPKERLRFPQQPSTACKIKNYPYAQFRTVMDINTAQKSNSNKGLRKPVIPSYPIDYTCCIFSFPNLTSETRLPSNVLDELSRDEDIEWKG